MSDPKKASPRKPGLDESTTPQAAPPERSADTTSASPVSPPAAVAEPEPAAGRARQAATPPQATAQGHDLDAGRAGGTDDHLAPVLFAKTEPFLERVGVGLVHLVADVLLANPGLRVVKAGLPLAGGDLLDTDGNFHGATTRVTGRGVAKARSFQLFASPRLSVSAVRGSDIPVRPPPSRARLHPHAESTRQTSACPTHTLDIVRRINRSAGRCSRPSP